MSEMYVLLDSAVFMINMTFLVYESMKSVIRSKTTTIFLIHTKYALVDRQSLNKYNCNIMMMQL